MVSEDALGFTIACDVFRMTTSRALDAFWHVRACPLYSSVLIVQSHFIAPPLEYHCTEQVCRCLLSSVSGSAGGPEQPGTAAG